MAERTGIVDQLLAKDIKGTQRNGFYRDLGGRGGMPMTAFCDEAGNLIRVDQGELSGADLFVRLEQFYGLTA